MVVDGSRVVVIFLYDFLRRKKRKVVFVLLLLRLHITDTTISAMCHATPLSGNKNLTTPSFPLALSRAGFYNRRWGGPGVQSLERNKQGEML
jgi:hypothetical protein